MKTLTLTKQSSGLYTVISSETHNDVAVTFNDIITPPIPVNKWKMETRFDLIPLGFQAQELNGITEAFRNTIIFESPDTLGEKCARMAIAKGSTGFGSWGGITKHKDKLYEGDEVELDITTWFPGEFEPEANPRLKFLRVHTRSDVNSNEGYLDLYILPNKYNYRFSHDNEVTGFSSINNNGTPFGLPLRANKWEQYSVYIKLHSDPLIGQYKVYQNGSLIYQRTGKTLLTPTSYADYSYIFTYWNEGSPKNQHMFVKKFSVTALA